jgi:ectoine hydroxylase-related dioxygenase (phytanoyl-CoA dioxygenase family)
VWTSCFKWLRGVPQDQNTGFHLDRVYMKADTPLLSLWLPLGDLSTAQGNLVVAPGSHRTPQFRRLRDEYGRTDVGAAGNGTTSGWIDVAQYTDQSVEVRTQADALLLRGLRCNSIEQTGLSSWNDGSPFVFSFSG